MSRTRFGFIGVTATQSSINKIFPRWAEVLGLGDVQLEPIDLPLDSPAERYRQEVLRIRDDNNYRGALVTSHKVRLLEAASDLFTELDPYARMCHELSCISKHSDGLVGHAKDPITAGRSLRAFLTPGHFGRTGAHVLCIGAGGSGLAISVDLLTRPDPADRPKRFVLVNHSRERLEACKAVHRTLPDVTTAIEYHAHADPTHNDELMAELPPGSLVINATGMGKDLPGSPVTDAGLFPRHGIAWELNYRGELDFKHQAMRRAEERDLKIEDGWTYFIHGWSEVIAEVFDLELTPEIVEQLSYEAAAARGD